MAVIIWVFKLLNNDMLYEGIGYDESHFVWGGWCILKGLVPYRDFLEFKPPVIFLTHALALALHGYSDFRFRWFFLYFPLLSLIALYLALLTRRIDKICALALILAIIHIWLNHHFHDSSLSDTESIGLTYYFFALACLIARTRFGAKLKVVGGGLLACCVLSKEPFAASALFTWLGCFLLDAQRSTLAADAKSYFKLTCIGAGAVVLALCLYLAPTGGLSHYVHMVRGYRRIYRDPQQSFCVIWGRFAPSGDWFKDVKAQWDRMREDFLNLAYLGYLVPFTALFALFVPRRSILLALAGVLAFAGGMWAVTASKCQWVHYYSMTMSGLFFAIILGVDSMTRRFASPTVNRLTGWILLAGVFVALWPRIDEETDRYRSVANAYEEGVTGVLAVIKKHTTPKDRIFTTGAPALYVQADRLSAVRESTIADPILNFYPGKTDEERLSGLRAQLERNMPKVVVIEPLYEGERVKHMKLLVTPFLKAHGYKKETDRIWLRPY